MKILKDIYKDLKKGNIIRVYIDGDESFIGILIKDLKIYENRMFPKSIRCIKNISSGVSKGEITYLDETDRIVFPNKKTIDRIMVEEI